MSELENYQVEDNGTLKWDIKASELKIKESKIVFLPVNKLMPHPDNRPLGPNDEKIKQLKILIANDGFDCSHPLVVRPYKTSYQILEGEHRYNAARALGYQKLPCVIRELDDTEALIQLILGNIQSETKPLEIGINALKVVYKDGQYSVSGYAKRLGVSDSTIRRYMNASEVFQYISSQVPDGTAVLDEVYKLEEIHRCAQSDWLWFHDLVLKNELSKVQVSEIAQAIRELKTDKPSVYTLFDFTVLRQEVAQAILKGEKSLGEVHTDLLQTIENSYDNLEERLQVFEYNVLSDQILSEEINLKEWYITNLKELKNLSKQNVLEAYKDALQLKRSGSKEEAERTAEYFRDKKNAKEREEQERIEKQMRQVKEGEWWQLGQHFLYCGDGADEDFFVKLPDQVALAFSNPPYITQMTLDENEICWVLDKLIEKSRVVAVAPEINHLQNFMRTTQMPYKWSMAAQLSAKKSEAGLGSWIYVALFSHKSIDTRTRDAWKIDNNDLKGNKSQDFIKHLLESFTIPHEVVVDTHAGLGEMFVLSENQNRVCYGAEMNPAFCKEIIERWEELTKGKAMKL